MTSTGLKYYLVFGFVVAVPFWLFSQISGQATVTVIGDPVMDQLNNTTIPDKAPPDKDQQFVSPKNIDPTFENGFHIRYEIGSTDSEVEYNGAKKDAYASLSGGSKKIRKKHLPTLSVYTFNLKKRYKNWVPKVKKKYRPHVCGRF